MLCESISHFNSYQLGSLVDDLLRAPLPVISLMSLLIIVIPSFLIYVVIYFIKDLGEKHKDMINFQDFIKINVSDEVSSNPSLDYSLQDNKSDNDFSGTPSFSNQVLTREGLEELIEQDQLSQTIKSTDGFIEVAKRLNISQYSSLVNKLKADLPYIFSSENELEKIDKALSDEKSHLLNQAVENYYTHGKQGFTGWLYKVATTSYLATQDMMSNAYPQMTNR